MNYDISQILSDWEYQAGEIVVRRFKGKDGNEKIQLRVDLGLLQMNVSGRPDGKQPFGRESLYDHFKSRLEKYQATHDGSAEGFKLTLEDCSKLQQEAVQFHHRYICLFQLKDYGAVLRDTSRNLAVFDFVAEHAENSDVSWTLQQLRPQLVMMHVRAKACSAIEDQKHADAIEIVVAGVEDLRNFYRESGRLEMLEQSGEIRSLETWAEELRQNRPLSAREKLEAALAAAVRREDYEKAGEIRDALRKLNIVTDHDSSGKIRAGNQSRDAGEGR
jgi:hypothetical protein